MPPKSSHYRMADRLAGGQLGQILLQLQARGLAADSIAARLYASYGIETTGTTVSNWLAMLETAAP